MEKKQLNKGFKTVTRVAQTGGKVVGHVAKKSTQSIKNGIQTVGKGKEEIIKQLDANGDGSVDLEDIIYKSLKVPGIKVDREKFLRKEFEIHYDQEFVDLAIEITPMMAGIPAEDINKIADAVIEYERRHVAGISAGLGIPGGAAVMATLPADIIQNFGFLLRCAQKLMYLYGFPQIDLKEEGAQIDSATMNILVLSLGVMFGVKDASVGLKAVTAMHQKGIEKQLIYKTLIKGRIFPIVKEVETWFEKKMIKELLSGFFEKAVPVVGAVVGGGITYLSFKKYCNRLKNTLRDTKLSNLKHIESKEESEILESILNEQKEFLLEIKPENYKDYTQALPDTIPNPKKGLTMDTQECNGMLIASMVPSSQTMDYHSKEMIIKCFHEGMTSQMALIECGVGLSNHGNNYAYRISKSKMDQDGLTTISYNLALNIKLDTDHYYIDGSFIEKGMTGLRDSLGLELFKKKLQEEHPEKEFAMDEVLKLYYRDPYDDTIQNEFLMNASETKEMDASFPKHPLSELRNYLTWVLEQN